MKLIAAKLLAAAISQFIKPDDWQKWADGVIGRSECPEYWILDLAIASDLDALVVALRPQLYEENLLIKTLPLSNLILGFYYLRFKSKVLSLNEFLTLAGDEADGGGTSDIQCEQIYALLNSFENCEGKETTLRDIEINIDKLFAEVEKEAVDAWKDLLTFFSIVGQERL